MSFDYFYGQQSDLFTFYRLLKRTSQELDDLFNGLVADIKSADVLGKDTGESGRQVQRFIRLTNLIPELLDMVDQKQISFNPAVELSYPEKGKRSFRRTWPRKHCLQICKFLSKIGGFYNENNLHKLTLFEVEIIL